MNNKEFAEKLKRIATDYKTLYVMGCFGAPLTDGNVTRYCNNHDYNKKAARTSMIKAAANQNPPVYGFDCVCLIKGVLWGWNGNASATYGGAKYASNGVPDIGADTMITKCSGLSTNFSNIEVGEAVWLSGHIGVYIGNGLAVECSPAFANKVQITAVGNIGKKSGYNTRTWTKHGKLPYITYVAESKPEPESPSSGGSVSLASLSVGDIVTFAGGNHYTNANAASGSSVKASRAKVTDKYPNGKHPVHLRAVDGNGNFTSGVYGWVDLSTIAGAVTEPPSGGSVNLASLSAGDIVTFAGGNHYTNANAASGSPVKASRAKVTDKYPSGKHPVHLRAVDGNGNFASGVYGWVDLSTITGKAGNGAAAKSIDTLAREVIAGKWGNGAERKQKLTAAGYDYSAVQARVNELL